MKGAILDLADALDEEALGFLPEVEESEGSVSCFPMPWAWGLPFMGVVFRR
jgi:hypothetical protein